MKQTQPRYPRFFHFVQIGWHAAIALALALVAGPASAQTLTEPGWTLLYTAAVDGSAVAVSVDVRGDAVVTTAVDAFPARTELRRFTPSRDSSVLTRAGHITGIDARPDEIVFGGDDLLTAPNQLLRWRGASSEIFTADFRPSSAGDDEPGGLSRVPASWSGGSVVRAGEILVTDSGVNDVVYAVDPVTGVARILIADAAAFRTLGDVAASNDTFFVADREARQFYVVSGAGAAASSPVTQTVTGGGIGGALVGLEHDPSNGTLLIAVGGALDQLVRLTRTGPNTWNPVVIGAGASFADTALQAIDLSDDGVYLATIAGNRLSVFARCASTSARDCDGNGVDDLCQVRAGGLDCNDNRQPDACDIAGGSSTDCDANLVPDECTPSSTPLEVVFAVSTSATNRPAADALCASLTSVVVALAAEGVDVVAHVLGVGAVPFDTEFRCLEGSVATLLGTAVPGSPPPTGGDPQDTLGMCGSASASGNDWGHATSIIAERFAWSPGVVRLVVNLASQGPYCGSTPMDASDDAAAAWATDRASMAGVIVSSMLGADFDGPTRRPTEGLAMGLALATGGTVSREPGPSLGWVVALGELLRDAGSRGRDCDDDGVADLCALSDACADCNTDGRLDVCDGPSLCESFHRDADGDGFGDPTMPIAACDAPVGHVADASDCDDDASGVFPGASEIPGDGIDQDCSGADICASGGAPDAGFCAADDAGTNDAGTNDAGTSDAGVMDGGSADDGGVDDAGVDGGTLDGGALDDAGPLDGGGSLDAARADTGAASDAGEVLDAGAPSPSEGCSCRAGTRSGPGGGPVILSLALVLLARRRSTGRT